MKATVTITKSFKDGSAFSKEWEAGDFKEFFEKEGTYLDKLTQILGEHGKPGEDFTVTYEVKVEK